MNRILNRDEIKQNIANYLIENLNLEFAYIFGSFLETDSFGDIDLALYSKDSQLETIAIAVKLEQILHISFDVIDLKKAPDHLIHSISKGEVIVDNNEDLRINFITTAWSRYLDFKYYRDRFLRELDYAQ